MTRLYEWNPSPDEMSIRCPACDSEAIFKFAFKPMIGLITGPGMERLPQNPNAYVTNEGGFTALVNYPDLVPWEPTDRSIGYHVNQWGVCTCPTCGYRKKHELRWPEEAYFVCEVKGEQLWAWDRKYVQILIDYIASKERKPKQHGSMLFLLHIPTTFLLAKNRDEVLKKLRRLLEPEPA